MPDTRHRLNLSADAILYARLVHRAKKEGVKVTTLAFSIIWQEMEKWAEKHEVAA